MNSFLQTVFLSIFFFREELRDGVKKGKISQICADSGWGKSMIGLNVLKAAQQQGLDCVVIDTEKAFNFELAKSLGIDTDQIVVFQSAIVPELKRIIANINNDLTREEQKNVFILLDSWGAVVEQQVLDKAEEGSSAVNMSGARFKNELAVVLSAYSNTVLVLNHVYATMQQYGDAFAIPGGKKLYFLSDAIMMASSAEPMTSMLSSLLMVSPLILIYNVFILITSLIFLLTVSAFLCL